MTTLLDGFIPYKAEDAERYKQLGCWANLTFGDILDRAADRYPNREAFVDSESRLTYAQARDMANRLALGLMNLGINPTDRALVQVPNWNEFVYSYFALQKIGAVNVLLIDRYREYEIKHLIQLTGATSWVVPEKYGKTDYLPIVGDVLKEHPQVKNVILVRGREHEPYFSLEKLLADDELTGENLARVAQTHLRQCQKNNPVKTAYYDSSMEAWHHIFPLSNALVAPH